MAAWWTSTSPCWTCRATGHPQIPRPTCAARSLGTSALIRVRRSGFARPRISASIRCQRCRPSRTCAGFPISSTNCAGSPSTTSSPAGTGHRRRSPASSNPVAPRARPNAPRNFPDWVEQVTRWQVEDFTAGGFVPGRGLLCLMPSGPHGVGSLRPRGRRAAGLGVPPDRPGSPVGQEARRAKRDLGDGRLCGPRAGASDVRLGDPGRRKPARDTAVGGGDRA